MVIQVELHTSLQQQAPRGTACCFELSLAEPSTVADVLHQLQISLAPEHLLLVVNRQVVDPDQPLKPGDKLDIIPAMSGGRGSVEA